MRIRPYTPEEKERIRLRMKRTSHLRWLKKKEELTKQRKEWIAKNPDYMQEYRAKKHEQLSAYHKKLYIENKEQILQKNKKWRTDNKSRYAETRRKYQRRFLKIRYPDIVSSLRKTTDLSLSKQDRDHLHHFYRLADKIKGRFGFDIEVDHIVPIKGKTVTGLHVPWNLQLLTMKQNMKKFNHFQLKE